MTPDPANKVEGIDGGCIEASINTPTRKTPLANKSLSKKASERK